MNHSDSITKLAAALVAAHADVQHATKDSTNPHFKSGYASLNSLIDTVKPAFLKHGLTVVQLPAAGHDGAALESVVMHESGEFLSTIATSPIAKQDPQGIGSAYTYLRRYSLSAIAGIAQEDDDGNAASYHPDQSPTGGLSRKMACPSCGSSLWDNIADKKAKPHSKSPDLKCSDKECGWAVWMDSWSENLLGEIMAAYGADLIDEKRRDRMQLVVMDQKIEAMVKAQKYLNELAND